jgi:hypothetical protein
MVPPLPQQLLFELPVAFTNGKYADMHFVYHFCDKSGRVAAVTYHQ